MPEYMTSTSLDLVFGSNDYAITGSFPENEEINDIQIIINGQDDLGIFNNVLKPFVISQPQWVPSPAEEFMERLWAFKRINYLLGKIFTYVLRLILVVLNANYLMSLISDNPWIWTCRILNICCCFLQASAVVKI